jgi:hypothetical protein
MRGHWHRSSKIIRQSDSTISGGPVFGEQVIGLGALLRASVRRHRSHLERSSRHGMARIGFRLLLYVCHPRPVNAYHGIDALSGPHVLKRSEGELTPPIARRRGGTTAVLRAAIAEGFRSPAGPVTMECAGGASPERRSVEACVAGVGVLQRVHSGRGSGAGGVVGSAPGAGVRGSGPGMGRCDPGIRRDGQPDQ